MESLKPKDVFVWCDIETTGLDPECGQILELGLIITDTKMTELARQNWVFHFSPTPWVTPDDFVVEMHNKSGLWEACSQESTFKTNTHVDHSDLIPIWLVKHGIDQSAKHPMCGSSVQFERKWIGKHMPRLDAFFGYRDIDVSSERETLKRLKPTFEIAFPPPGKREIHRALPDLEDSIALMEHYRMHLYQP